MSHAQFPSLDIIRFVDEHQPGFVEAELADANGASHTLVDKVPVFSLETFGAILFIHTRFTFGVFKSFNECGDSFHQQAVNR
jgi:hypothetical protein